jgi:hypothetical protein
MDDLPDNVLTEIREHVQAGRCGWEDALRVGEEHRLLEAVFSEERER